MDGDIAPSNRQPTFRYRRFPSWDLENFRRVGIFYGRKSSRHARPTHLRAATPRRCDGFFSNRRLSLTPLSRRPAAGRESRCQTPSSEIEKFSFPFPFFSSAFIRPSPANHVTTTSSGLRNFFQLFFSRSFSLFHPPLFIQVPPTTSLPRRRDLEKFSTFFLDNLFPI